MFERSLDCGISQDFATVTEMIVGWHPFCDSSLTQTCSQWPVPLGSMLPTSIRPDDGRKTSVSRWWSQKWFGTFQQTCYSWLVVYLPFWKNMKVRLDHHPRNIWEKTMFQNIKKYSNIFKRTFYYDMFRQIKTTTIYMLSFSGLQNAALSLSFRFKFQTFVERTNHLRQIHETWTISNWYGKHFMLV